MTNRKYYDLTEVGSNMKAIRKKRHATVEQVRDYLGLECTQSIYKWERGDCLPQADTLIALCVYYGVNPLSLFGESLGDEPAVDQDVNFDIEFIGTDIPADRTFYSCFIFTGPQIKFRAWP